ncbi:protein YhfH [Bacillus thermotolerans]|nr:protein YhfH [Bacillus thermotolerans]
MVKSIVEFFKNLPSKQCVKCGSLIEEQHESYIHTCDECTEVHDI